MSSSSRVRAVTTVLLAGYWLVLLTATHLPTVPAGVSKSDKLLHFLAFGVLGFLVGIWLLVRNPSAKKYLVLLAVISTYAAVDELTQPLTGRHGDVWDWVADTVGAALGLLLAVVMRRIVQQEARN